MVMHPISLSFIEPWNEYEWTYKKAIFTVAKYLAVATMMSGRKRNHQVKPSFHGKVPSSYGKLSTLLCRSNCSHKYITLYINFWYFYVRGLLEDPRMRVKCKVSIRIHTHL